MPRASWIWRVGIHVFIQGLPTYTCGWPRPVQFTARRTVFIPKSSDVNNHGFIVRSTDGLRPLTLLVYLQPICLSGSIAKQVPHPLGWYLKQERNVKILSDYSRKMVFPIQLTASCVTPVLPYWRRFAPLWKFWFQNYQRFFPVKMPTAMPWFLLSTCEHKSSAFSNAEMELANRFLSCSVGSRTEI